MSRQYKSQEKIFEQPSRPVKTDEAREIQMISLAIDRAEEQLKNGTASSQVITHYLKLGATREKDKLEREILKQQKELMEAKTKSIQSAQRVEELYANALAAMRGYSGANNDDEEDIDGDDDYEDFDY